MFTITMEKFYSYIMLSDACMKPIQRRCSVRCCISCCLVMFFSSDWHGDMTNTSVQCKCVVWFAKPPNCLPSELTTSGTCVIGFEGPGATGVRSPAVRVVTISPGELRWLTVSKENQKNT